MLLAPNLDQVKRTLIHLLKEMPQPIVVAIKGGWGEGKTHFWKRNIAPELADIRPGYVSVFGAESLEAIRNEVVVEATRTWAKHDSDLHDKIKRTFPILKGIGGFIAKRFGLSVFLTSALMKFMEQVVFQESWVLCLDDVERLPKSVEIDAFLGYVNSLRDDRKIKIVLIYNSKKFGNGRRQKLIDRYIEKVVDRELPFSPDIGAILKLVLESDTVNISALSEVERKLNVLQLRNIRILNRVKLYYQEFIEALPENVKPEFLNAGLYSLLLFAWVKFAKHDSKDLTFEYLSKFSGLVMSMTRIASRQSGEQMDDDWRETLLAEYEYSLTDDLDLILIQFVETSVLDKRKLLDEYDKYVREVSRGSLERALTEVWNRYYHGTLEDVAEEFCEELIKATRNFSAYITINSFDSVLETLRELGRNDDALKLLQEFKEIRSELIERINPADLHRPLQYPPLADAVQEVSEKTKVDVRSLDDVIQAALKQEYLSARDAQRISEFSAQDLAQYFTSSKQKHVTSNIRDLAKWSANSADLEAKKVHQMVLEAAKLISEKNRLNFLRMKSMGLVSENHNGK